MGVFTATAKKKNGKEHTTLVDLVYIDALKLDGERILGLHRGGAWLILSENESEWEGLQQSWRMTRNPFNGFNGK